MGSTAFEPGSRLAIQPEASSSAIDSGELPIRRELFPLLELLEDAVDAMFARAGEKQVQLDLSFRTPIPVRAIGDAARLRQALVGVTECMLTSCHGALLGVSVGMIAESALEVKLLDTLAANAALRGSESLAALTEATARDDHQGLRWTIVRHVVSLLSGSLTGGMSPEGGSSWTVRVPLELPDGTPRVDLPGSIASDALLVVS